MPQQPAVSAPQPVVPLSLPRLVDYVQQWRGQATWPSIEVDLLLVLYDILVLSGAEQIDFYTIFGDDGVDHILAGLDTTVLTELDGFPLSAS